jgi:MarR family transcriptional regulator for hemolysin
MVGRQANAAAQRAPLDLAPDADCAPDEPLGRLLAMSTKAMREWFDARLVERGGSLTTWIVLLHTVEDATSPSQRELARRMGIGGATMVHHLDRLEAEGLVVRRGDERDRRVTRVEITEAGRTRFEELAEVAAGVDAELHALMTPDEAKTFRSVLHRIADHATRT